ncbi:hypothetical protein [Pseudomonas sp. BBP2017]|uniref:hypothetical protein n=1 Tax=Pseudomonas sp. BBP2017 TaxID=2109731 RepID=UPI000D122A80|nr:hypothetical protein [Pseudomonas sp. BBP2017]PSS56546.1 hypothetical protein C6382_14185 [Pseudomonas sp. BBP2017]
MVDTSASVQAEFLALVKRIKDKAALDRPAVILVYSEICPACTTAKTALTALADDGFRARVDFYQIPGASFKAAQLDSEVDRVPSYLLYDRQSNRSLFTGASTELLKKSLEDLLADVEFEPSPPA